MQHKEILLYFSFTQPTTHHLILPGKRNIRGAPSPAQARAEQIHSQAWWHCYLSFPSCPPFAVWDIPIHSNLSATSPLFTSLLCFLLCKYSSKWGPWKEQRHLRIMLLSCRKMVFKFIIMYRARKYFTDLTFFSFFFFHPKRFTSLDWLMWNYFVRKMGCSGGE